MLRPLRLGEHIPIPSENSLHSNKHLYNVKCATGMENEPVTHSVTGETWRESKEHSGVLTRYLMTGPLKGTVHAMEVPGASVSLGSCICG